MGECLHGMQKVRGSNPLASIDSKGRPRCVNHGAVRTNKLIQQLTEIETSVHHPGSVLELVGEK